MVSSVFLLCVLFLGVICAPAPEPRQKMTWTKVESKPENSLTPHVRQRRWGGWGWGRPWGFYRPWGWGWRRPFFGGFGYPFGGFGGYPFWGK